MLTKIYFGEEEDYARDRDGEVEMIWAVEGDNLKRLICKCAGAKTTEQALDYLCKHFTDEDGMLDDCAIRQWWDKKNIHYSFWTYP